MDKQCAVCRILLDIRCPVPGCPGHDNARIGDMCAYCAQNRREEVLLFRHLAPSLVSSFAGFDAECEGDVSPSSLVWDSGVLGSPVVQES
jgi:hypothetical protein